MYPYATARGRLVDSPPQHLPGVHLDDLVILAPPSSPVISEYESRILSQRFVTAPRVKVQLKVDIAQPRAVKIENTPLVRVDVVRIVEPETVRPPEVETKTPLEIEAAPLVKSPTLLDLQSCPAPIEFSFVGEPRGRGLLLSELYLDPIQSVQRMHLPAERVLEPFGLSKIHILCSWPGNSRLYTVRLLEAYNKPQEPTARLQIVYFILKAYVDMLEVGVIYSPAALARSTVDGLRFIV
ncbi:uncharacterized protein B0H18DRAFT_574541 [Fomitopsis serialis]|uniref:uncharacterized protein n=1 Tax=Fomitopsis serialis TaxID=139415 RepID=UPI0020075616|nr:uncharacterized protein B0H18DRAFT_574541 [Neoantrodia serialis]KAH9921028.1 hypothetical protein B0H18DRAFT_574541 [Neoantrodia serialis]